MKRLGYTGLVIASLMIAGSVYFGSKQITLSLAAGSLLIILSYAILCFVVSHAFSGRKRGYLVIVATVKLAIVGLLLWYMVARLGVHPLAFLIGLSTMVFAIVVDGIYSIVRRTA